MSNDIFNVAIQYESQNYTQAVSEYEKFAQVTNKGTQAEQNASKASQQNSQSKQRLTRATRDATSAQQRARQQFLATANSIAVLDGPLGGVASRFSAFGVLIGRIGIPLAGLGIALSTFTFVAQRSVREFMDWEVSLSTIENRLNSVGNQLNLTTQEIVSFSERLALSTLASERDVISAANSLLTFRNITTDLFDDILTSAQDLAASGFGTIESETLRLAKALEDPRQGLTSLSRAGITFTRQQRQLIISMVDTGREAEAMGLVLRNVERQVGGAGLAQANNTLAGSFDTIGQATRTATRRFGEFVVESLLVRGAIDRVAEAADDFVRRSGLDEQSLQIENLVSNMKMVRAEIETLESLREDFGFLDENQKTLLDELNTAYAEQAEILGQLKGLKEESLEQSRIERDLAQSISDLNRRGEALDNLESQIDLQQTLVGLTQEQERVQRALFAEGFGGDVWASINQQVNTYAQNLRASGVETGMIQRLTGDMRRELEGARDIAERYAQVFKDQQIAREINQIEQSTASTNEVLRRQVEILEEARAAGNDALTVTEARRQAEIRIQEEMIETRIKLIEAADATQLLRMGFEDAADAAAEVARLAGIIASLREGAELQTRIASLGRNGRNGRGGSGGGGGVDPNAEYQKELESLQSYLEQRREEMMIARGFERELILEQYEERFESLQTALERELVTRQEYDEMFVQLVQSREDRIAQVEREAQQAKLAAWSGALGDLGSLMSSESNKIFRIGQAAAIAQATVDGYSAAVSAWDKGMKAGGPPVAAAFTAMSLARTGALIAQIGSSKPSGTSGGGGASARTADAPREAREATPQRVLIQGLDPSALYTGEQLQNLFDAFQDENKNRGQVFVVSQ